MFSTGVLARAGQIILVAVVLLGLPQLLQAQTLTFRNDTASSVVVLVGSVTPQGIRRARPYTLQPKDSTPPIQLPGNRVIFIYDASNPTHVLFRSNLPASTQDLIFSIRPDALPGRVKLQPVQPATGSR